MSGYSLFPCLASGFDWPIMASGGNPARPQPVPDSLPASGTGVADADHLPDRLEVEFLIPLRECSRKAAPARPRLWDRQP
jgi:hypothetical protein